MTGNFAVDHLTDLQNRDTPDDPSTDPEGAQQRAQRPPVNTVYAADMMEYNAKLNRWEPAKHFIERVARDAQKLYESIVTHANPLDDDRHRILTDYLYMVNDSIGQGPFTGFLYGTKDTYLKQFVSSMIWLEANEDIRASKELQGAEPEDIQKSDDALAKNEIAIQFLALLLKAMQDEHDKIALNEAAFRNAAQGAAWDFLGYQRRSAQNPEMAKQRDSRRRSAEEIMGLTASQ